jgi:hypothetical protein
VLTAKRGTRDVDDNYKAHQSMLRMVQVAARLSRDDIVANPPPGPGRREDAASDVLTDGLTQIWALANTNTIIIDIDLNTRSPRVTATRTVDVMPHASSAAKRFVKDLSEAAGRPEDLTQRELLSASPRQRWNVIADWMIDRNLSGLIDDRHRAGLRRELADIAHDEYARVAKIPDRVGQPVDKVHLANALRARGTEAGAWAVRQLNIKVQGTLVDWGHQAQPETATAGSGTRVADRQHGERAQRTQRDRSTGPNATR